MKPSFLTLLGIILLILCTTGKAGAALKPAVKGLYVNGFDAILGNEVKEDSLLAFAKENQFNYLTLYDLHTINDQYNLTDSAGAKPLANFISKAKQNYGIKQIGGAGENYPFFRDVLNVYNKMHPDSSQKFDVFNLEFEFWIPTVVASAYCAPYLKPGGYSCDTAGAFSFYLKTLFSIDSLAHLSGVLSETYIGWPNAGQAVKIANICGRILLHAYVQTDADEYSYLQRRLHYFESCIKKVVLLPIFSAEGGSSDCGSNAFMGTWLSTHPETQTYSTFVANFNASLGGAWKNNISIQGYQWFDYSCLTTNSNSDYKIVTGIDKFLNKNAFKITQFEHNQVGILLNALAPARLIFYLKDVQGKLIYSQSNIVDKGLQTILIPINDLPPGMYILQGVFSDGTVVATKFIK